MRNGLPYNIVVSLSIRMLFLISNAFADAAAQQPAAPSALMQALPLIFVFGLLYFFMILPQQKRAKQHKNLLASLKKGDRVITNSGIIGTITKIVNDNEVVVEIADKVFVKFVKATIATVLEQHVQKQEQEQEAKKDVEE